MKDEGQSEAMAALDDARHFLEEATALDRAGFAGPSLRSSYYAMFNAARALLLAKNIKARTHRGVMSEFNRVYVHDGLVPQEFGGDLSNALSQRMKADYESAFRVTEDDADWVLERADAFVSLAEKILLGEVS